MIPGFPVLRSLLWDRIELSLPWMSLLSMNQTQHFQYGSLNMKSIFFFSFFLDAKASPSKHHPVYR